MNNLSRRGLCTALMLCLCLVTGCGSEQSTETTAFATTAPETTEETEAPRSSFPMELTYSSGAGGWRTVLVLNEDGSFSGSYTDSELGEMSEEYPNGTIYYCNFTGRFELTGQPDGHTYALMLTELNTEVPAGEAVVENGVRHMAAEALGLSGGSEFLLYTPDAPASVLSEFAAFSWPGRMDDPIPENLGCWALWNVSEDAAFFTYDAVQ